MSVTIPNASSKRASLTVASSISPFFASSQSNASISANASDIFGELEVDFIPDVGNVPCSAMCNSMDNLDLPNLFSYPPKQRDSLSPDPIDLEKKMKEMQLEMYHEFDADDRICLPSAQGIQFSEGLLNTKEPFQFGKVSTQAPPFAPSLDLENVPTWPDMSREEDDVDYFFAPGNEFFDPSLDDLARQFGPREIDPSEWNSDNDPDPNTDDEMDAIEAKQPMETTSQPKDTPQEGPQDLAPLLDGYPEDTACCEDSAYYEDTSSTYITLRRPPHHALLTDRSHLSRTAKSCALPARLLLAGGFRKRGFLMNANDRVTRRESVKTTSKRKWAISTLPPKVNSQRDSKTLKFSKENTAAVISGSPYAVVELCSPIPFKAERTRKPPTLWRCPYSHCNNVARTQAQAKRHVFMHSGVHIGCPGCSQKILPVEQLRQHVKACQKAYELAPASQNSPCATRNPSWRDKDAWTEARVLEHATLFEAFGLEHGVVKPVRIKWI